MLCISNHKLKEAPYKLVSNLENTPFSKLKIGLESYTIEDNSSKAYM
jgi:hypothetical protein